MKYKIETRIKVLKILEYNFDTGSYSPPITANVEYIILKYHYEDDKLLSEGWFDIYRIGIDERIINRLKPLLEFLGLANKPIIDEAELLGCGEKYAFWIFDSYITKGDLKIVRAMVLEEVKKEMKKVVETAQEISDPDEAKEYIFKNAEFFRELLESPEIGVLYVAAKKYWREVVKEDPTEILKAQRVQLLLKEDES